MGVFEAEFDESRNFRVKEIIQEKQNKHCLITVERGSYYPGN